MMKALNELKKRDWPKLIGLQDEVRKMATEYFLSVFARIRFIRLVTRSYWAGMEAGYLEGMKDGEKRTNHSPGETEVKPVKSHGDYVAVVLVAFMLLFSGCAASQHSYLANGLWFEKTHHKPVKRLSRHECRKIAEGKTMYYYKAGKVYKR